MLGHREQVESLSGLQGPLASRSPRRSRANEAASPETYTILLGPGSSAASAATTDRPAPSRGGIEDRGIRRAEPPADNGRRDSSFADLDLGEIGCVPGGIRARPTVAFDGEHGSVRTDDLSDDRGEEAGARIEIRHTIAGTSLQPRQHCSARVSVAPG